MFEKSQEFYDAIYSWKDYGAEAHHITKIVEQHCPGAATLLDVACGTGMHLASFCRTYSCEGLDLDAKMVEIAGRRAPSATLHVGDFRDFDLNAKFDVVVCLFSSIGYAKTLEELQQAIMCMATHVAPGGLLLIEPWLSPEGFQNNMLGSLFVDRKDLKIARLHISVKEGSQSHIDFNYLVGIPEGISSFVEPHVMGLYSDADYKTVLESAGLKAEKEEEGPMGRGLWIAIKS